MSRFFLLTVIILFLCTPIDAQDSILVDDYQEPVKYHEFSECLRQVFLKGDSIRVESGEKDEIDWLKENRFLCDKSSPVTRRVALRYMEWGDTVYDDKGAKEDYDKKELFKEGLKWSEKAVNEDTLDHLNYEIRSMGFAAVISVSGLRGKANMADSVRIYAEEAIRLNPENDRAHHILGRWHYEVSKLGWFTKLLAKVLFRNSTDGSFEQAISYFKKALETDNIVVHRYWLGMVYLEEGDKEQALEQFRILQDLPIVQGNDQYFKDEAKKLIEKLR